MLYKMEAEAGKDGRGLVIGRIYARDGRLIAVCVGSSLCLSVNRTGSDHHLTLFDILLLFFL
jgi:acyl-CoA thioesterase